MDSLLRIIAYPFLGLHPNVITLLSLLSSLLFFVFMLWGMYILAFIAFLGTILDAIDGYVARRTNKASRMGGFLDSVSDRISDFLIISAFGYAGLVVWEIVVLTLFTTLLVSYVRARGEQNNTEKHFAVGLMQRTTRILLIGVAFLLFLAMPKFSIGMRNIMEDTFLVLTVVNSVTVLQRMVTGYRLLR